MIRSLIISIFLVSTAAFGYKVDLGASTVWVPTDEMGGCMASADGKSTTCTKNFRNPLSGNTVRVEYTHPTEGASAEKTLGEVKLLTRFLNQEKWTAKRNGAVDVVQVRIEGDKVIPLSETADSAKSDDPQKESPETSKKSNSPEPQKSVMDSLFSFLKPRPPGYGVLKNEPSAGPVRHVPSTGARAASGVHGSSPSQASGGKERPFAESSDEVLSKYHKTPFVDEVLEKKKANYSKALKGATEAFQKSEKSPADLNKLYSELDKALAELTGEAENVGDHLRGFTEIAEALGDPAKTGLWAIAKIRDASVEELASGIASAEKPAEWKKLAQLELDRRSDAMKFYVDGAAARTMTALGEIDDARAFIKQGKTAEAASVLAGRYGQLYKPVREELYKEAVELANSKSLAPADEKYVRSVAASLKAANKYWDLREEGKDHAGAAKQVLDALNAQGMAKYPEMAALASAVIEKLGKNLDTNNNITGMLDQAFDSSRSADERAATLNKIREMYRGGEDKIWDYLAQLDREWRRPDIDEAEKKYLAQRRNQWAAVLGRKGEDGNWYLPVSSEKVATELTGGEKIPWKPGAGVVFQAASADDLGQLVSHINGGGDKLEQLRVPQSHRYHNVAKPFHHGQKDVVVWNAGAFKKLNLEQLAAADAERKAEMQKLNDNLVVNQDRNRNQPTAQSQSRGATSQREQQKPVLGAAGLGFEKGVGAKSTPPPLPREVVLFTSDGSWYCPSCDQLKSSPKWSEFLQLAKAKGLLVVEAGQPHFNSGRFYSPSGKVPAFSVTTAQGENKTISFSEINVWLDKIISNLKQH